MFDEDSSGRKQLALISNETFYIPFAFLSMDLLANDLDAVQDIILTKVVSVSITSSTYGHVCSLIKVHVTLQRPIINRNIRYFENELSILKKSITLLYKAEYSIEPSLNRGTHRFVHCLDMGEHNNGSRVVVDWTSSDHGRGDVVVITFRYKCMQYPSIGAFMLFIYADPYHGQLMEVCS